MAGLYIHIPFCRKACYYCDFHFVASLKDKNSLIKALIKEIELRRTEWSNFNFDTIYFGGGTPSVLEIDEIVSITNAIYSNYNINPEIEFTLEANPDDLNPEYLEKLKKETKINRFSLGVQSFNDNILKYLNRQHNAQQAIDSILNIKKAGFESITLDLIYGIPGLENEEWLKNLQIFNELGITHLSAYHLAIEPKTVFAVWQKRGKFNQVEEEHSLLHYEILTAFAVENGFDHYEISNFAKNNQYSKHNTSYWKGTPYLGIGPSAHSYNKLRRWNIANNSKYIDSVLNNHEDYFENEKLSKNEMFNDYILTSLRTKWGVDFNVIKEKFGEEFYIHCIKTIEKVDARDRITLNKSGFRLSEKGWFIADYLMSEFFIV